jgi:hypothetical protein
LFKNQKAKILVYFICEANLRIKDENLKKSTKDAIRNITFINKQIFMLFIEKILRIPPIIWIIYNL